MEKDITGIVTNERTPFIPQAQRFEFVPWCRQHKRIVIPISAMVLLLPLLGLIALKNREAHAQYYTSPIVYPSPQGYGAGNWSDAYQKAKTMVQNMTLEEMNNVTIGVPSSTGCVGVSGSAPRVGFPGLCLHDAGNGVRDTDGVNSYASGLHIGASWNASLAHERAVYMGAEFKTKGVNIALGPVVGPLGRIAEGGRNWEAFAADPYLDGILGAATVQGMQQSVIASVKHFIVNEQETNRNPSTDPEGSTVQSTSANVDDQTLHELYLWPFQDLVFAGAGSIMCSYNRINNTHACENSKVLNGILKGELDFQGFVVSDWSAQHSGLDSANAGLDMAMPASTFWNNDQLADAVNNNTLNRTRLEDMATRIVAAWYQFGQDDPSFPPLGTGMAPNLLAKHAYVNARDPSAKQSLLQQAVEGHVLVKNTNNALPLTNLSAISIFGYDAIAQVSFDPGVSMFSTSWEAIGLQQNQTEELGYNRPLTGAPQTQKGTLIVGGGSGSNTPAYISDPYCALQERAYNDNTAIFYDFSSIDPSVVSSSQACLVFINEYASEAWDRPGLADPSSDDLVSNVAAQCNNTIVVIHNAGIRTVDPWIANPNVTAVLFAHLPGQDAGRAVVQILYGDVSPSGRLPYTVAQKAADYGNLLSACQAGDSSDPQCDFTEGVNVDYRHFLARNVTPRFEFGYGLTYSEFTYSDLALQLNATASPTGSDGGGSGSALPAPVYANGTTDQNAGNPLVGVGGLQALFESVGSITASVANTGSVPAAEVAQLYLQIPAPPSNGNSSNPTTRVLRGFEKVFVAPGESAQVSFNLRRKDVSYWNTVNQSWVIPSGEFQVFVGKSVLDTPLTGSFTT